MNVKISELPEYIGIPQPVGDIPISINGVTYKIKPNLLSNSLLNLDTVLANGNTSGRNINILGVMGDLTSTNTLSDTGISAIILDPTIGNFNYYGNFNAYGASLQTIVLDQNGYATSTLIAGMFTSGFSLSRLQNGYTNLSSLRLNNSDDPFLEFGKVGGNYTTLKATWGGSNIDQTFLLPNKGSGTYTLATLNDIGGGGGISQTSQLINDGADGVNPFITALDIPTAGQAGTLVREVKNMTGATLTKGTVVYISGANGNKPLVSKAKADTDATSARTFGLLQSDILNNGLGNCVIIGDLSGLDTSAFAEGAQLYLSGTTAGTYTSTKPVAPIHLVYVGKVTRSHPTQGQIEIGVQNGYELDEIHDVLITTPTNNQALIYESSSNLWKNKTIGIQQILQNGNTTETGLIFNVASENFGIQLNLAYENSIGIGMQTNSGLAGTAPILISNENNEILKCDSEGIFSAHSFVKYGGTPTQYLMADGSTSSGGTPAINAFSILANNTSASAVPTVKVYKEVGEQYLSGTGMSATGGSLPTGTQTHSYRWSQIGNLVTLRINLQFGTAGTCSGIAIPFANMSDIPQTPQHSNIYSNALEMITYGSGNLSANKLIGTFSVGNGASGIRLSASANTYEVVVGRASNAYANGWIHLQYYI